MDSQDLLKIKNGYDIVGNNAGLNRAIETAVAVAPTDLTVLITGESGVGKEAIPQIIHKYSPRKHGTYLAVNCGAIPEGTINAELFGHEKGSFTGAIGERKGYFEEADGGTLFLDEIGELPKETQALLLRVLQNGEFMKVGSSKVQKTNVRVIAATNVSLENAVARGKFREDLYYRLNAVQIKMPSLRERKDDIYLLFRKFTSDFSERYNLCKISLDHEAISLLQNYRWPGNIRQLKNFAEYVTTIESRPVSPSAERIELGAAALAGYLPDEKDTLLPAMFQPSTGGSEFSESEKRNIINAIMELKSEVDELKKHIHSRDYSLPSSNPARHNVMQDEAEWQEQSGEPVEQEPVKLRQSNDELIWKVLEKHGGKVKPAAVELGISERTIYRKIAERKYK